MDKKHIPEIATTMSVSKTFYKVLFFILAFSLITTSAYWGLSYYQATSKEKDKTKDKTEKSNSSQIITADGYLEPKGEIVTISSPFTMDRAKVEILKVKRGDWVRSGQIIAILDSHSSMQTALQNAAAKNQIALAQLEQTKAGAKLDDIKAKKAKVLESSLELTGQVATQKADISRLEAQLSGRKSAQIGSVERIEAELRNAKKECQRYRSLYFDGAVSTSQMNSICLQSDTSLKRLEEAQATLKQIVNSSQEEIRAVKEKLNLTITTVKQQIEQNQANYAATAEVRPVDIAVSKARLQAAQAELMQAQSNLDLTFVRSPIDGQILEIHAKQGEIATNGIVEVGNTKSMFAVGEVYETDIGGVKLGQKVTVKSSALLKPLYGTVSEIGLKVAQKKVLNDDPVVDTDARVVKVRVALDAPSSEKAAKLTNLKIALELKL